MSQLDQWIEASSADPSIKGEIVRLKESIPLNTRNPVDASIQIKSKLKEKGFVYNPETFKIQDVLRKNGGNCLGLPLLVGCLLNMNGFTPSYRLVVRPKDVVDDLENKFHSTVVEETSYNFPRLRDAAESPFYRFVPLEHLAIDTDGEGFILETTSEEDRLIVDAESMTPITFNGVISQVYKDRALELFNDNRYDESRDLIRRGLDLWSENRQLYCALIALSAETFDDEGYDDALNKISKIKGEDSLWDLNRYYVTQNLAFLDRARERYPAFAEAISAKARTLSEKDPREARFMFSVASQLYANSQNLDLGNFYVANLDKLRTLFGSDEVLRRLEACREEKFGDFDYHLAMYNLTGDETHLFEAEEAAISPRQTLYLYDATRDTPYFDSNGMEELEAEFSGSRVYQSTKKDLKMEKIGEE